MAYDLLETSTIIGLQSFLRLGRAQPAKTTAQYYYAEEETEKFANKYQKRFGIHQFRESLAGLYCKEHHHPWASYAIVYFMALGVEKLCLEKHGGNDIVRDVLNHDTQSDTFVCFKMQQMDFLSRSRLNYEGNAVWLNTSPQHIQMQRDAAKSIFDNNQSMMSPQEENALKQIGEMVDIRKGYYTDTIILQPTTPKKPGWLFPRAE